MTTYVGRFAPSPTGPLHMGSLVAAVASYADALSHGGRWLLRIEDVDETRTVAGAADAIIKQLQDHGFRWHGDVEVQSHCKAMYETALSRLTEQGLVYPCDCSRKAQERLSTNLWGERIYDGRCDGHVAISPTAALRFRAGRQAFSFTDRVCGIQNQNVREAVGDFVVKRADGFFAYQLAVVVDDARQCVTHVVRGADLLGNTARQVALQQALGYPTPNYMHVPIVTNASGEKLSKQTRAPALDAADSIDNLLRAWQHLSQLPPIALPRTCLEFWDFAAKGWNPALIRP